MISVLFNKPHLVGNEMAFIKEAAEADLQLASDGLFSTKLHDWLAVRLASRIHC